MDKSTLYYIVTQGTNSRIRNEIDEPVIFLSNCVDRFVEKAEDMYRSRYLGSNFIKISVEEYERTYGVDN